MFEGICSIALWAVADCVLEETKVKDIKISQQHISKHVGKDANRDTKSLVRQCLLEEEGITSKLLVEFNVICER